MKSQAAQKPQESIQEDLEAIDFQQENQGIEKPKFKRVEIYESKQSDYLVFEGEKEVRSKKAKGFKIEIQLDRIESASEIDCNLDNQRLVLQSPEKYYLAIDLKGEFDEQFKAQFVKKTKRLTLTFLYNKRVDQVEDQTNNQFFGQNQLIQQLVETQSKLEDIQEKEIIIQNVKFSKDQEKSEELNKSQVEEISQNLTEQENLKKTYDQDKNIDEDKIEILQDKIESQEKDQQVSQIIIQDKKEIEIFNINLIDNKTFVTLKINSDNLIEVCNFQNQIFLILDQNLYELQIQEFKNYEALQQG